MSKRKYWISTGRNGANCTNLYYGPENSDGEIEPQGVVITNHNDGSRSRWIGAGDSKEQPANFLSKMCMWRRISS